MSMPEVGWQQLARLDAWPMGVEALTWNLSDKEWLCLAIGPIIWFDGDCPLKAGLIDLVYEVASGSQNQIARYLSEKCELSELLPTILERSRKFREKISRDICLRDLADMEQAIDDTIIDYLRRLPPRSTWRILGFGGGDCSYEHSIGRRLSAYSGDSNFMLYRFDPEACGIADGVTDVDLELRSPGPQVHFDVVICRWVLHHVPKMKRWGTFDNAVRKVGRDGAIVIVEEGDFSPCSEQTPARRAYRLIVACEDILVNGVLRPSLVDTMGDSRTAGFHLNYLTQEELLSIERHIPVHMKRHTYLPGPPGKFGEAVIIYT